jgi:hypothetical protein
MRGKKMAATLSSVLLLSGWMPPSAGTLATLTVVGGGTTMMVGCSSGKSDTRQDARTEARTSERAEERVEKRHD